MQGEHRGRILDRLAEHNLVALKWPWTVEGLVPTAATPLRCLASGRG